MSRVRFPHLAALALTTFVVAVGCDTEDTRAKQPLGGDPGEVDTSSGEGSSGGDTGDADQAGAAPSLLLECGLEPACEVAPLAADIAAKGGLASADLLCVIAALGDGDVGLVQTVAAFDDSVANLDFALLGGGEALRQAYGQSPGVGEWVNAPMRCTLQGPEFFAACAAEFTPACADPENWIVACRPIDAFTCPAP